MTAAIALTVIAGAAMLYRDLTTRRPIPPRSRRR